ncbi:MAG TPA: type IV secretory system conjugative DNA transfer family protein, partial [Acidimicrobiales bacterium]|nr:type IV secretory system conjugative DNA transfer family protein [Acidimicrobiales bacterium]
MNVGAALGLGIGAVTLWKLRSFGDDGTRSVGRVAHAGRMGAGSGARWATRADLRPLAVRGPVPGRVALGRSRQRLVAAERGHSVLVVGPTQSGKTSGLAIPAMLEWEGPVVTASVKADLARHTMAWRRAQGPVWLYDPSRATPLERSPWSPLAACSTWSGARRVAQGLTDVTRPAATGSLVDGDFWYATATKLLAPLLHAAALSGRSMTDVVRWVDEQEQLEVADVLFAAGAHEALQAARATWARDD